MDSNLDRLFIQGKLSEEEYCALAMNEGQVVAIAVCEKDRITTISLSLSKSGYLGEVLYSPDLEKPDEKFLSKENNFDMARNAFLKRIGALENTGRHKFETTWF